MTRDPRRQLFNVGIEQHGRAAHLRLSGELDMASSPTLELGLSRVMSNGNAEIVVDLQNLTFMDASGLRTFLTAAERARESGREFVIANAPAVVRRVLAITQTLHLLGTDPLSVPREPERQMSDATP